MVLGSEESLALSHAQQLLVIMYYSGPLFVVDHILQSPVCVTYVKFLLQSHPSYVKFLSSMCDIFLVILACMF